MRPVHQRRLQEAIRMGPEENEQNRLDDLNPANLRLIDMEMRHPNSQSPKQQAILSAERKRLEGIQAQQMIEAGKQQFQQRLYQRLNPRIGTAEDTERQQQGPAQMDPRFMEQLMLQMRGMPRAP